MPATGVDRRACRSTRLRVDGPKSGFEKLPLAATQTAPLTEYYEMQGKLEKVNGMQSEEQVFADIRVCVAKH